MNDKRLVVIGILISLAMAILFISLLFNIVSAVNQIEVRAEVRNPYDPISTPAEPQQSMTIEHQRDLLNAELR